MMKKAILVAILVLQILSNASCNLATQLVSRKLIVKFTLGYFIQ